MHCLFTHCGHGSINCTSRQTNAEINQWPVAHGLGHIFLVVKEAESEGVRCQDGDSPESRSSPIE